MCHYAVNWCDKLRFFCIYRYVATTTSSIYTVSQKTCDYIFYNNFNNRCPITVIFGIVSSKSMLLDRWGGKWNHHSMTHRLATNYAKNYCIRTLTVKVIVENVVTCFLGHSVLQREHHEISAETGIRQMSCYIRNIDSRSNLLLNTICFVLFGYVCFVGEH